MNLRHYCKCGYSTTVSTAMFMHLSKWVSLWERLTKKHEWTHSERCEINVPHRREGEQE